MPIVSGTVIASIPAGIATGATSGLPNVASTSIDNTVYWGAAVAVTINKAAGQADPMIGSPVYFDVVFAEPVIGFGFGDVVVSGTAGATAASGVSGSGATYLVSVTGMTTSGTVIATIPAGVVTAVLAGAPNLASTSTDNSVYTTIQIFTFVGQYINTPLLYFTEDFVKDGNLCYITGYDADSFSVIDVSNPATPTLVGSITHHTLLDTAGELVKDGNFCYVTAQNSGPSTSGLTVINVSNPAAPTIVGTNNDPRTWASGDVVKSGNYCFVTHAVSGPPSSGYDRLSVIDVSNPATPTVAATVEGDAVFRPFGIVLDGNYCYTACYESNVFAVVDVSTPTAPFVVGSVVDAVYLNRARGLVKDGNICYVTCPTGDRLTMVDVSNPAAPTVVASIQDHVMLDGVSPIFKDGNYVYVGKGVKEALGGYRVASYEVSDPTTPIFSNYVNTASPVTAIVVEDGYIYNTDYYNGGLYINSIT